MNRSLIPLVLSLVGVSVCAAACFVMLAPYQIYQLARRQAARARLAHPALRGRGRVHLARVSTDHS